MEAIIRTPTKSTPYVHLDRGTGTYLISGRSIPIDAELFYKPLLNWLEQLTLNPPKQLEFCFKFDFFNIASSKRILFILYKLSEMKLKGCQVTVRWMYEKQDDDNLELGKDYELMVDGIVFIYEVYDLEKSNESQVLKFG
jgi:hypothetical protein